MSHELVALAWMLVHSLWQGGLVGATMWLLLRVMRTPAARYRVACTGIGVSSLLAVVTLVWLARPRWMAAAPGGGILTQAASAKAGASRSLATYLHDVSGWEPWLASAWIGVVFVLLARQFMRWRAARRLREGREARVEWQRWCAFAARRAGVRRHVEVVETSRIDSPMVVGVLRPAVLIPPERFVQLPPNQAIAILTHELAHVRRHDYLAQLVQTVIETLFFFHPVLRALGHIARHERERICDGIAANACGDAVIYARALFTLEQSRTRPRPRWLAVGADSGSLLGRIRTITEPVAKPRGLRPVAAALVAIAGCSLALATSARTILPASALAITRLRAPSFYTVNAHDDAGPFTLTIRKGRAVGATIDGYAISPGQIMQRGDSVYLRDPVRRTILALQISEAGGFTWSGRSR